MSDFSDKGLVITAGSVIIIIVLAILYMIYSGLVGIGNSIDNSNTKVKIEKNCIKVNNINISEYTLKCVWQLKVEENAYIANTCFEQAKLLYWCDN